jgi:hypothetical protein
MSDHGVDLSAIRGDWDSHARYVTNAMEQTLKRAQKLWRALKAKSPIAGRVPMDSMLTEEFIEACRQTRALTDDILLLKDTKPVKRRESTAKRRGKNKSRAHK